MKKTQRTRRIGDLVAREISGLLTSWRLDPDPGLVTITGCEISIDLHLAKVYYSVLGSEGAWERAARALERVRGRLRHEIGHRVKLRVTPELVFIADHTAENADRIERALREEREALGGLDDDGGD